MFSMRATACRETGFGELRMTMRTTSAHRLRVLLVALLLALPFALVNPSPQSGPISYDTKLGILDIGGGPALARAGAGNRGKGRGPTGSGPPGNTGPGNQGNTGGTGNAGGGDSGGGDNGGGDNGGGDNGGGDNGGGDTGGGDAGGGGGAPEGRSSPGNTPGSSGPPAPAAPAQSQSGGPCGPNPQNDLIVLLPDLDGNVGKVIVTTAAGSQTLGGQGNLATQVGCAEDQPSAPFGVEQAEVEANFGDSIAAQPEPPEVFTLYFEFDSTDLAEGSRAIMPEILDAIRNRKVEADVDVIGHTDTAGNLDYNSALSERRAEAVRRLIAESDIEVGSLETFGHGENNPLVPTADGVYEPRNRRVEVNIR
jgi:outer membrane protein OmpA-like peptidoglycan-associated protein